MHIICDYAVPVVSCSDRTSACGAHNMDTIARKSWPGTCPVRRGRGYATTPLIILHNSLYEQQRGSTENLLLVNTHGWLVFWCWFAWHGMTMVLIIEYVWIDPSIIIFIYDQKWACRRSVIHWICLCEVDQTTSPVRTWPIRGLPSSFRDLNNAMLQYVFTRRSVRIPTTLCAGLRTLRVW